MTPAIKLVAQQQIAHQVHHYLHDAVSASYGLEAMQKLGVDGARIFKTLVVQVHGVNGTAHRLTVAVIPVTAMLSMKLIARAAGAKKAVMAEHAKVERATGYVLGGVSPLGQKKRLTTFIDDSAQGFASVYVSAGKRGMEIELSPNDLQKLTQARFVELTAQ